jgi:uroporphyrinogen decarboxylase
MGGMDRKGILVSGSKSEIKQRVKELLRDAPNWFILGADCTLPSDIDWDNIKTAIATAHQHTG